MPSDNKSSRRLSRRRILESAGAAGLIGLSGCVGDDGGDGTDGGGGDGNGDDGNGGTTTEDGGTVGTPDEDAIVVGAVHPLTGPYGALAEFQEQGLQLAVQMLNDDGGLLDREVESVHEDSQLDPETGGQRARKLYEEDGADLLNGAISSSVAAVLHDYGAEVNVPYMSQGAANFMTMEDCKRTTFRYEMRANMTGVATAPWAVDKFGDNFWIHNADYSWGNSVAEAWTAAAESAGGTRLNNTKSELGATDFSTYVSEIAASDADWVATGMNGGDMVNFLSQASSFGLGDDVAIVSPTSAFQFIRKAAGSDAIGTYATIRYYEDYDIGANQDFVSAFEDQFGRPPDNFAHTIWVSTMMWADAVERAGSVETDEVIPALEEEVEFDGPMGTTSFRACDHQALRPVELGRITEPGAHDWPDLEIETTVSAEDAIQPCDETGCEMN